MRARSGFEKWARSRPSQGLRWFTAGIWAAVFAVVSWPFSLVLGVWAIVFGTRVARSKARSMRYDREWSAQREQGFRQAAQQIRADGFHTEGYMDVRGPR